MLSRLARLAPQPLVGAVTLALALAALGASFAVLDGASGAAGDLGGLPTLLLTLGFMALLVMAYRYPIHIRHQLKVYMTSVPLYLMAVLLPWPLAVVAAGLGILSGEVVVQKQTGNPASAIATAAGRYVLVVLVAAIVAHLPASGWALTRFPLLHDWPPLAAAAVLWAGDFLTVPLVIAPMSRQRPSQILVAAVREAGLAEAAQYLLGLLGWAAASTRPWTLPLLLLPTALVYLSFKSAKEMRDSTRKLLEGMADAVDLRDPYTGGHSRRVIDYSASILRELKMQGPEASLVLSAARVHDIGKIGIPDHVLKKPGRLTAEERSLMEQHPGHGAELLLRYPDFARGVAIVRHHHEAWDGSGYPDGLAGDEIPFGARVVAVADSFDAMTSDRPYRQGMSFDQAAEVLRQGSGRQWDTQIVAAFLRTIDTQAARPARHLQVVASSDERVSGIA